MASDAHTLEHHSMSTTVRRLYRCLVEAIQQNRPELADRPVAVAEIYQSLVPYRTARQALGLDANADYELALLRLLAGEGDLVRLEPTSARDELRRELRSTNPNVGLFRKFAACDVRVNMAAVDPARPAPPPPAGERASAAAAGPTAARPAAPAPPTPPVESGRPASSPATGPIRCPFCRGSLPTGRTVRYCPGCGQDQSRHPCGKCGEVVEADWRFCVACGAAAQRPSPPA